MLRTGMDFALSYKGPRSDYSSWNRVNYPERVEQAFARYQARILTREQQMMASYPGYNNFPNKTSFVAWDPAGTRALIARAAQRRQGYPVKARYPRRSYRSGYTRTAGYYGRFNGGANRDKGTAQEKKFFDVNINAAFPTVGASPSLHQDSLNKIPQGDTEDTRDGRQCVVNSLEFNGVIHWVPAATEDGAHQSNVVELWLVLDKQCNGASAAVTDVFDGGSSNAWYQFRELSNSKRFRIIKHWKWNFNALSGGTYYNAAGITIASNWGAQSKKFQWFKKCNIPLEFSTGVTGAITTIKSNNLCLYSTVSGSTLASVSCSAGVRLRFRG